MFFPIRAVIFSKWESNHVKFLKGQIPDKLLDYTFEYVIEYRVMQQFNNHPNAFNKAQ